MCQWFSAELQYVCLLMYGVHVQCSAVIVSVFVVVVLISIILLSIILIACKKKGPQSKSHFYPVASLEIPEELMAFSQGTTDRQAQENHHQVGIFIHVHV